MRTGSDVVYLDASALVKLAISESETDALRRALPEWPRRASSRVSVVELLRVVRRRDGSAEPLARNVLASTTLLTIGDRVLMTAAMLDLSTVRALDAIHLASALRVRSALGAFVSYDADQLRAAEALGLPVASPR